MVSFFTELKRRNVIRMGMAYLLIAWVLLQAADFGFDLVGAPEWVVRSLFVVAVIGLPAALVFAWIFELTPEGIRLEKEIDPSQSITAHTARKMDRSIILFLGLAVAMLLVQLYVNGEKSEQAPAPILEAPRVDSASTLPSIAVLPFVDMSAQGDQAYFSDGIAEEILNVLVKTDRMKVAGRTSSFQFDGRNQDLRSIGQQLGVEHILEGSVRKAGNRVRITAQLVKAEDGFHLWSETYDRELTDIFAVQDEIARAIAQAMAVQLDLGDRQLVTASTGNMQAYELYLAGRSLIASRTDFERAAALLEQATDLDANFAPAWAGRAQILALLPYYQDVERSDVLGQAEAMAKRAVTLDPNLSTAHSVLGDVYRDRSQFEAALESYTRALELNPSDVEAHQQLAQFWMRVGFFDTALHHGTIATELDPLSWLNLTVQATILYLVGDTEAAWATQARSHAASGVWRDFQAMNGLFMAMSDGNLPLAREMTGVFAKARLSSRRDPNVSHHLEALLEKLDDRPAALAYLREQRADSDGAAVLGSWEIDTLWAIELGDIELALQAFAMRPNRNGGAGWLLFPALEPLRAAYPEQWKAFFIDDGALAFWQSYRFPDFCRALGGADFECD